MRHNIFRTLAAILGLFIVAMAGSSLFFGFSGTYSAISGMILGAVFISYGVSGNKYIHKLFPETFK